MKTCIIAPPRTRSNYMIFQLSNWYQKHYNSKVPIEPYADIWSTPLASWDLVSKITAEIFSNPSFVIKIQTTDLAVQGSPYIYFHKYNLLEYDSIFLLHRSNIIDQISSLVVAYEKRAYIHTEKPSSGNFVVTFDLDKHYFLIPMILEDYMKLTFIKKYLKQNQKSFIPLDYDEVVDYTRENFPDVTVDCVETGFDYKNMISNYEVLKELIETYFENFNYNKN
jgi:uncharacterized short protein YbdD (DUF466 family)